LEKIRIIPFNKLNSEISKKNMFTSHGVSFQKKIQTRELPFLIKQGTKRGEKHDIKLSPAIIQIKPYTKMSKSKLLTKGERPFLD
jgi:hypothetical protein